MADDDQMVLILTPAGPPGYERSSEAVEVKADCGHQAWISPGGIQTQARLGARTMCFECVPPEAAKDEFVVTPEVYAQLVSEVGQAQADHLVELAKSPELRAKMLGPNSAYARFVRGHTP